MLGNNTIFTRSRRCEEFKTFKLYTVL